MHKVVQIVFFLFVPILLIQPIYGQDEPEVYLLEWGWNTPYLQDIPAYMNSIQILPFDGMVLDIRQSNGDTRGLSWVVFTSSKRIDAEYLAQVAQQFEGFEWGRAQKNFLRLNILPADTDWFDDFEVLLFNVEQLALLAKRLGFAGIMFDTEQYGGSSLFEYEWRTYNQTYSVEGYHVQVYNRGRQVIQAMNRAFPDIEIIFTFGLTTPQLPFIRDVGAYDLLFQFIWGMKEGATPETVLIDGFESSYGYRDESQFATAQQQMKASQLVPSFGLWIDPGCQSNDITLPAEGCGFNTREFELVMQYAHQYSQAYVWLYSHTPNWYTGQDVPSNWMQVLNRFRD